MSELKSRLAYALLLVGCGMTLSFRWVEFTPGGGIPGWTELPLPIVLFLLIACLPGTFATNGRQVLREATILLVLCVGVSVWWAWQTVGSFKDAHLTVWPWIALSVSCAAAFVASVRAGRSHRASHAVIRAPQWDAWPGTATLIAVPLLLVALDLTSWHQFGFSSEAFSVALALGVAASLFSAGVVPAKHARRLLVELARLLALVTALGLLDDLAFEHRRFTGNWPRTGFSLAIEIGASVLALVAAHAADHGRWTTTRRPPLPAVLRIDRLP